jgi:pimeloyl-ACP methyl ester carboxylesterase
MVASLVMHRPELVRSWVSDVLGIFDPDYVWHDLAQAWITPGAGEELVAAGQNEAMGRAILAVYRSTAQPVAAEIGSGIARLAARPGLAILATEDTYVGTDEMRRRTAARAGATVEVLDGLGHWWMLEDPARGAAALTHFWGALPH